MIKQLTPVYKNIDANKRAKAIKRLTNNGRNKKLVRDLQKLMSNQRDLEILNALWEACND